MNKPVNTTKTTAWNGALIADQMTKLRKDIEHTRTSINSRRADYSNEGFTKLKNERYAPLQERLAELTNVSQEWSAAARNHANRVRHARHGASGHRHGHDVPGQRHGVPGQRHGVPGHRHGRPR